jgi:hypothetical protein
MLGHPLTGSAMLFLASQTSQNQGNMTQNFANFLAAVMTSLLHVLRVFSPHREGDRTSCNT